MSSIQGPGSKIPETSIQSLSTNTVSNPKSALLAKSNQAQKSIMEGTLQLRTVLDLTQAKVVFFLSNLFSKDKVKEGGDNLHLQTACQASVAKNLRNNIPKEKQQEAIPTSILELSKSKFDESEGSACTGKEAKQLIFEDNENFKRVNLNKDLSEDVKAKRMEPLLDSAIGKTLFVLRNNFSTNGLEDFDKAPEGSEMKELQTHLKGLLEDYQKLKNDHPEIVANSRAEREP